MMNEERSRRTGEAGVHDNPDFILQYLQEIEILAEEVLAERRDIIELHKRRDKLREANRCVASNEEISRHCRSLCCSRALQKQPNNIRTNWMCMNNNFLAINTRDCKQLIDRGEKKKRKNDLSTDRTRFSFFLSSYRRF